MQEHNQRGSQEMMSRGAMVDHSYTEQALALLSPEANGGPPIRGVHETGVHFIEHHIHVFGELRAVGLLADVVKLVAHRRLLSEQ